MSKLLVTSEVPVISATEARYRQSVADTKTRLEKSQFERAMRHIKDSADYGDKASSIYGHEPIEPAVVEALTELGFFTYQPPARSVMGMYNEYWLQIYWDEQLIEEYRASRQSGAV